MQIKRSLLLNLLNKHFRKGVLVVLTSIVSCPTIIAQTPPPKASAERIIEDNSFFIEEAYNQEEGVVQHISGLQYSFGKDKDLLYTFTQEWPLFGPQHQISYTIPYSFRTAVHPPGFGDVLLNYRYQLIDNNNGGAVAPRLSLVLPTGSTHSGLGGGAFGVQINLPASLRFGNSLAGHVNAGWTYIPGMKDESLPSITLKHTLSSFNLGASIIWLTAESYNVMLEYTATFSLDSFDGGSTDRSSDMIVSPGFRYAINLNALQIVPGIGFPVMVHDGTATMGVFLYLSFEHPY